MWAWLGMKETKEIFGESIVFELRGLLIETSAHAFRDRLAHGMVTEHDCYASEVEHLWWLVLRLCLFPFAQRVEEANEDAPADPAPEPSPLPSE